MAYQGRQPGIGIRNRFIYTATASQTTFSGTDSNGLTLAYQDGAYVDVYLNGVLLIPVTDYTSTTKTSVTLTTGATSGDAVEILCYDIASIADTVSKSSGGTFDGAVTVAGNFSVDGGTIKLDGNYPVGTNNVALGDAALDSNVSGASNVAIGADALTANTTASQNTAVGYQSLTSNTTGINNTAVGKSSLSLNTTGVFNAAMSMLALQANTTGSNNTATGYGAVYTNTTGNNNTGLGQNALFLNTTGGNNTAVGYQAGYGATGSNSTFVGYQTGFATNTGTGTAFGYGALQGANSGQNTAIGVFALKVNTSGTSNAALGDNSLVANTTGGSNTAVGQQALYSNTTASYNTSVGFLSLQANTTGIDNTAVGYQAGYSNTTNSYNTYLGDHAGYAATNWKNTFLGHASGEAVTTGGSNTILGRYDGNQGGLDIRTSSNNIVLSDGDGNPFVRVTSFSFNYQTGSATTVDASNPDGVSLVKYTGQGIVRIGNTATAGRNVAEFFNGNGQIGAILTSGTSTSYNTSSDYRLKENVVYDWDATTRLKQLKPARFNFIADADTTVDGFLAHEAQAVVPECVTGTKDAVDVDGVAVMQGIDQSKLVPLLVKTIQELEARITALEGA
jgi:trimeric autotransporter adhesin